MGILYKTDLGEMHLGKCEDVLNSKALEKYKGKVQLLFTSPPFPLNRKKKYGNLKGDEYLDWIKSLAPLFKGFIKPKGSIVVEIGNAWVPGEPVQSTLPMKTLLAFQEEGKLKLCQEFTYYNPARLPSPAQWVNIERIRVKDSTTKVWWLGRSARPYANNKNVLKPYSDSQKKLFEKGKYNSGKRPSEFDINETSFLKDHGGAIPPNLIEVANTKSSDPYLSFCRENEITPHPARMPLGLVDFFVKFLTKKGDIVLDPFGGSNTTGTSSEALGRKWISIEADEMYAAASASRFSERKAQTLIEKYSE